MADDPTTPAPDDRRRLVLLHGFTQNHRCLGPFGERMAQRRGVLTPDLPGHGYLATPADLTVREAASGLVTRLDTGPPAPHWFGYSMGGRVALRLALDHPPAVASLVLLGATAGIRDEGERLARRRVDEQRARRIEAVGVEQFCREWLEAPMFAGLPVWARFDDERASNTPEGLAGSLRHAGTGSMEPLWDRLGTLGMPVLLLAGARDDRFVAIAEQMAEAIGANARVRTVADAGHAAHLERPGPTADLVEEFLAPLG